MNYLPRFDVPTEGSFRVSLQNLLLRMPGQRKAGPVAAQKAIGNGNDPRTGSRSVDRDCDDPFSARARIRAARSIASRSVPRAGARSRLFDGECITAIR